MNADAFRKVADAIEEHQRFNLWHVAADPHDGHQHHAPHLLTGCGYVGCVWGWTVAIHNLEIADDGEREAADALGLTGKDAERLFYADTEHTVWVRLADEYGWTVEEDGMSPDGRMLADWSEITADQAADVLRRIADGEVVL